jgi:hypothetical protein
MLLDICWKVSVLIFIFSLFQEIISILAFIAVYNDVVSSINKCF